MPCEADATIGAMSTSPTRTPPVDALGRERRVVALEAIEVRAADDGGPIAFRGHAAVFERWTQIGSKRWGFREKVGRGAFTKTIQEADVRFLHNHNPDLTLARTKEAGTLRLAEDKVGLAVDADMAPTSYARDLAISLERKDITQMSFGFRTVKDEWVTNADGSEDRTLLEVQLFDVSTVTYPAYTETDAALRGATLRGAALDALCGRMGLDASARVRLLEALAGDEADDDTIPLLRAASTALAGWADEREPRSEPVVHSLSREIARRKLRLYERAS